MAGPILITGAGSGFGKEVALRLAAAGHEVIADVEIIAQVTAVRAEARERGVGLRVEKLDVTDPGPGERPGPVGPPAQRRPPPRPRTEGVRHEPGNTGGGVTSRDCPAGAPHPAGRNRCGTPA